MPKRKDLGTGPEPMGFGARLRSLIQQKGDIELPNESGQIDPRIPRTGEALLKAMKTFRDINRRQAEKK